MASNQKSSGQFTQGARHRVPKPYWRKAWLVREYTKNKRSAAEIAAEFGCHENNILHFLNKHGIARRTISEARQVKHWGASGQDNPMFGKCGLDNPHWLGGISPERQRIYASAMWKELRQVVIERDGGRCVRCNKAPRGHRQLQTHHIKTWAKCPRQRFNIKNIVTICRKCHEWTHSLENTNRELLVS